jgi:hypothetical protein
MDENVNREKVFFLQTLHDNYFMADKSSAVANGSAAVFSGPALAPAGPSATCCYFFVQTEL